MGICEHLQHRSLLDAELGYEAADVAVAAREAAERAIYDGLRADLLCKVPGAVTRFVRCNSEQLGELASIALTHWDDAAAAGLLIRRRFNAWMWEAAQEEAAND